MARLREAPAPPRADGVWKVVVEDGVHWLRTPSGKRFYGCGVNGVHAGYPPEAVQQRPAYYLWRLYPSVPAWALTVRERLGTWGFNHVGAWAFGEEMIGLPSTPNLDLGRLSQALWWDPFDPSMPTRVTEWAYRLTGPHREAGVRIGYFPDNEIGWWNAALFMFYLAKEWGNTTKQLLWQLLYERYEGRWPKLLEDWVPAEGVEGFPSLRAAGAALRLRPRGDGIGVVREFTYRCAERYYRLMHDALRAADPDALIFSDRLPIYYSQDAVRAMAPYVDAVAVNYNVDEADGWIAHYFFDGLAALSGKGVLVSEFFCAAMENRSGNKNAGHLLTVPTQRERATVVARALQNFARFPQIIGTQWFQYHDEPQGGRPDGEDYNMGLVDIEDQPYEELVEAFAHTHPGLGRLHAGARPRPAANSGPDVTIARAERRIDLSDRSLTDWDKDAALLRGFAAEPPDVPFADIYMTWDPGGLYLATIGMDYMHPGHLWYDGPFPLSETYQLHWLIAIRQRTYHVAIHFLPEEVTFSLTDATNARGSITLIPRLYGYGQEGGARPMSGARVQHLDAGAPRISCEAHLPPDLFGVPSFERGMRLKMNVVVLSHYRAQEMFWSEGTAARTFSRPEGWRVVTLGQRGEESRA
jgi:hypothetical protein